MDVTATNVDLARRGYEAAARGDMEAVAELLAPDAIWHGGELTDDSCHNRGEILVWMQRARDRGAMGELVDVIDAGDRVIAVMRPPGSDQLRANVSTFRDGRVVEMQAFERVEDARAAVGLAAE